MIIQESVANEDNPSTSLREPTNIPTNGERNGHSTSLPPPFEGTEAPFHPQSTHVSHISRASLDGIVFGAIQDSPGIPSTPHELDPENNAPQPLAHHPPGFAPPPFAPPFYPGHSHHPSDSHAAFSHPVAVAPHNGIHSQIPYQGARPGPHAAQHAPIAANGMGGSHSQSPHNSQFNEAKPSSDQDEDAYGATYQNGSVLPPAEPKSQSFEPTKFREPYELAGYLATHFGDQDFADFILRLRSDDAVLLTLPAHGVVVARSPMIALAIRKALTSIPQPKDARPLVDILIHDKYVTPEAINEALKVLYGGPLLSDQPFLYGLGPFHPDGETTPAFHQARNRMSQVVSYAAAGRFFGLPSMVERGTQLIKSLLRWDTFDMAITFALESSINQKKSADRMPPGNSTAPEDYFVGRLLNQDIVDFIAYHFPISFKLHTIAPEMKSTPRLPSVAERPSHNPRLSRIRFGDVPAEDELDPNYVIRTLSTVLLTLPLPLLDRLLNHPAVVNQIGWKEVGRVMQEVVGERERRRQRALKGVEADSDVSRYSKSLLENLVWEERVEPSPKHTSGYTLLESRVADRT